jgi:hypothetical protein
MKTNVEILSNISTDCEPVTLSCSVDEARNLWLDVTSYHDRSHLELCVESLESGGCVAYLEDWSSIDEIETGRSENYISIILFLGVIICLG